MSTIAFLAFFIALLLAPASPITWLLLTITLATLTRDTYTLIKKSRA